MNLFKKYYKYILVSVLGVVSFIFISNISQYYVGHLKDIALYYPVLAPLSYIFLSFLSIVIAPLGFSFLLPVAGNAFGPFWAGVYSILGWFLGSLVAFWLARRYGYGYVKSTKLAQKIQHIEEHSSIATKYLILIALRLSLPVDVLSYVLGLFTKISYKTYIVTTLIGISPFAFLFTYASVMSWEYQLKVSILSSLTFVLAVYVLLKIKSDNK